MDVLRPCRLEEHGDLAGPEGLLQFDERLYKAARGLLQEGAWAELLKAGGSAPALLSLPSSFPPLSVRPRSDFPASSLAACHTCAKRSFQAGLLFYQLPWHQYTARSVAVPDVDGPKCTMVMGPAADMEGSLLLLQKLASKFEDGIRSCGRAGQYLMFCQADVD